MREGCCGLASIVRDQCTPDLPLSNELMIDLPPRRCQYKAEISRRLNDEMRRCESSQLRAESMNVEISDQTTQRIQAIIGMLDPVTINTILKRIADDEQLLLSLTRSEPTEQDLQATRDGLEDVAAGRTQPFAEFDAELRSELGLSPRISQ